MTRINRSFITAFLFFVSCPVGAGGYLHVWPGEMDGDYFGSSVAAAGDADGDGVPDVLVGASEHRDGWGPPSGKAYLFSGKTGRLIESWKGKNGAGRLGWRVASAGDLDGDGRPDPVISAPEGRRANVSAFSGNTGKKIWRHRPRGDSPTFPGHDIAPVGDLDRDGIPDFVFTAAPFIQGEMDRVAAVSGRDGLTLWSARFGSDRYAGFNNAVSGIGDVNGDGVPDVAVGTPESEGKGTLWGAGRVYAVSGVDGAVFWVREGTEEDESLGGSLSSVPDVDGDGAADVIAAAKGRVTLFSGRSGALMWRFGNLDHRFGYGPQRVAGGGDFNGDGVPDVASGGIGEVVILSGVSGLPIDRLAFPGKLECLVAFAGDVNGDGLADLVVGTPRPSGQVILAAGRRR